MARGSDLTEELLFYTGSQPIREMLSSVDPAALAPGQFQLIDNFSLSKIYTTARWGCARISAAPVGSAAFRGGWAGYMGGVYTILAAFRVSGATRIYRFTGSAWSAELTVAGTRFSTDGYCDFAPFVERGGTVLGANLLPRQSGVLIGNGTDECGVVYYDASGLTYGFARIAAPTPNDYGLFASQATPGGYWLVRNSTLTTYTNSGANLTMADSGGTTTQNEINMTFNAAGAAGDTSVVDFGATGGDYDNGTAQVLRFDESRQFHIIIEDTSNDPVFNYLKIEVYNATNTTYYTVYDPATLGANLTITAVASGVYMASFDLTPYNTNLVNMVNLQRVRFTISKVIGANRTPKILAVMAGGMVDASAETIVAYILSTTRVESAARVCDKWGGPRASAVGASDLRTFNLPSGEGLFFKNWIYYQNPTSTTAANFALFYRKDPGDEDYFLAGSASLASTSTATQLKIENARQEQKDYGRKAPSAFTISPPKASCLAFGSDRMFAGGVYQDVESVYISDEKFPMRFVSIPRDSDGDGQIDSDSGTVVTFPGEVPKRIFAMPGSVVGISPMAIMTNRNTWRVEGIDALSLSDPTIMTTHGTLYPWSVCVHKSAVYFIDSESQPRVIDGGYDARPLGVWKVENQFPDPTNSWGVVTREQYKVALRASGASTNQKVMVYERMLDGWHRHSYTNPDWAALLLQEIGGSSGTRTLGITTTGEVFEVEQPAKLNDDQKTGSGTDSITITLTTGELHGALWETMVFARVAVLCDKSSGSTITVSRVDPNDAANTTTYQGSIDLATNVADRAWRYDQYNDSGVYRPAAIQTQSCYITFSGNLIPGKYWKGAFIEVRSSDRGPDVAN
jgi:hypothetical protein